MGTVVGVGMGTALALQRKNVKPFILLSFLGTVGDLAYGTMFSCRPLIDEMNKAYVAEAAAKAKEAKEKASIGNRSDTKR